MTDPQQSAATDDFQDYDWSAWSDFFTNTRKDSIAPDNNTFTITIKNNMPPETHRYDLNLPNDIHWELVKLGAEHRMDYETYAEEVLKGHVEEQTSKIES